MEARRAFERFEKSASGSLPIAILSIAGICITIAIFHLSSQLKTLPRSPILILGYVVSRSTGYATRLQTLSADDERRNRLDSDKQHFDALLPSPGYVYVGTYTNSLDYGFHLYIDTELRAQVHAQRLSSEKPKGDPPKDRFRFTSFTDDGRAILSTGTEDENLYAKAPWLEINAVKASGSSELILSELRASHRKQTSSEFLVELTPGNCEAINLEHANRLGEWLMQQAPLTVDKFDGIFPPFRAFSQKADKELFLIGFCDGLSEEFDRVAIDTYRQAEIALGKTPPSSEELVAIHAMTNRFHIAALLTPPSDETKPMEQKIGVSARRILLAKQKTLFSAESESLDDLESFLMEFFERNPIARVGEIDKPFAARIYLRVDSSRNEIPAAETAVGQ